MQRKRDVTAMVGVMKGVRSTKAGGENTLLHACTPHFTEMAQCGVTWVCREGEEFSRVKT